MRLNRDTTECLAYAASTQSRASSRRGRPLYSVPRPCPFRGLRGRNRHTRYTASRLRVAPLNRSATQPAARADLHFRGGCYWKRVIVVCRTAVERTTKLTPSINITQLNKPKLLLHPGRAIPFPPFWFLSSIGFLYISSPFRIYELARNPPVESKRM